MRLPRILIVLCALLTSAACATPLAADPWRTGRYEQNQYDRGYREGYKDGEHDARRGRVFDPNRDARFRRGSPDFRRGYAHGYRTAYDDLRVRARGSQQWPRGRVEPAGRAGRDGYQDPAFARGFSDGYERGLEDGRDRDRYDPVRHRDYRQGDDGYHRDYGGREAYKDNYRSGFRQGYEQGYREGTRYRRR